jgi:hypothetical protein
VGTIRTAGEIGFGLLFTVGAVFNLAYTLRHGAEFYGGFADNAWLGLSRTLVRDVVIPNASLFTLLIVAIQVTVATAIFTRSGFVVPGLVVGSLFALGSALVSNVPGAMANLGIAVALALLAWARWEA